MLPALFGHWCLALLAAILGLSASGEPAAAYEYEPLRGEPTV